MQYIAEYQSPVGNILLAAEQTGLTGLWFEGQKFFADSLDAAHKEKSNFEILKLAKHWLDIYFSGKNPEFSVPVLFAGTDFQKRVWHELEKIPYGQTVTYGMIAGNIGCKSAQAAGNAIARNHISVIVPCHRVVGKGNVLTGYAGGLDRKQALLDLENNR